MINAEGDWRHRAVCRDEDPELFFPVGDTGPALQQIAEAKAVCRRCPVQTECLAWAVDSGQDAGVWGGMSEDERRALKRRNAPAAHQTNPRSRQGKKTHVPDVDVEYILRRLDDGARLVVVAKKTGFGREVCRRVWREHRSTKNPPGDNARSRASGHGG